MDVRVGAVRDAFDDYFILDKTESEVFHMYLENASISDKDIAEKIGTTEEVVVDKKNDLLRADIIRIEGELGKDNYHVICFPECCKDVFNPFEYEINNERDYRILSMIKEDPFITQKVLAERLGVDIRTVRRHIKYLKENELIYVSPKKSRGMLPTVKPIYVPDPDEPTKNVKLSSCRISFEEKIEYETEINNISKKMREFLGDAEFAENISNRYAANIPIYKFKVYESGDEPFDNCCYRDVRVDFQKDFCLDDFERTNRLIKDARQVYHDAYEKYNTHKSAGVNKKSSSSDWHAILLVVKFILFYDGKCNFCNYFLFDIYDRVLEILEGNEGNLEKMDVEICREIEYVLGALPKVRQLILQSENYTAEAAKEYWRKRKYSSTLEKNQDLWKATFFILWCIFLSMLSTKKIINYTVNFEGL